MSYIDLIFIFFSGLEIFSTFNIHHSVDGCPFHVRFNLIKSTIVNYRFVACPVRQAVKRHQAEKKVN